MSVLFVFYFFKKPSKPQLIDGAYKKVSPVEQYQLPGSLQMITFCTLWYL